MVDRVTGSTSFEVLNDGSLSVYDLYRQMLGDFGALVRTASLVLTEEMLHEGYRDPANLNAPSIPPYLRPKGVTSWPAEYPKDYGTAVGIGIRDRHALSSAATMLNVIGA
jgi:hypothetical protein